MHTIAKFEVFAAFNAVNLSVALCASSNFYREIQIRHFCPPFCCRLGALCRIARDKKHTRNNVNELGETEKPKKTQKISYLPHQV